MKKSAVLIALALAFALALPSLAANGRVNAVLDYAGIKINISGREITPTDVNGKSTEPFAINGSTYVPVRAIAEAVGYDVEWNGNTKTITLEKSQPVALCKFMTDINYTAIITDSGQDQYFKEGNALDGVEAILNAGNYYVNGYQVPRNEEECGDAFVIMGYEKLYKTENGWAAENNKRTGTTFDDARLGMVEALSRTTGLPVYIYDTDGDGYADRIDSVFYAVAVVDHMIDNGDGTISIDRGDFELTKTNLDVNTVKFPIQNVDPTIQEGDMAMFWQDAEDGWMLEREQSISGYLTDAADHQYYVFNDEKIIDGMNNPKASIYVGNRPGQYSNAHLAFELNDVEIIFWVTTEGSIASGFTSGANSAECLKRAIAYCENARKDVVTSSDGSGVEKGGKWIAPEKMVEYYNAIKAARAVLADETATNAARDAATYNLFVATWGSSAKYEQIREGIIAGGFLGSVKTK